MIDPQESEILQRIRPTRRIAASNSFRERVMKTIAEENAHRTSSPVWRWAWVAAAAAALLVILPMLPMKSSGVALLAQSVQAMANVHTVHITGRIRTLPNDNFELTGTNYDFVPIEIWREYTTPPRWRVEKPGRIVVMDGQNSLLYLKSTNEVMTGTPQANFFQWLRPLLDPQSILEGELSAARKGEAQATVNGTAVAIHRQARGNFANDWARNHTIPESDHTCVYRFDSAAKRLEGLQVLVSNVVVAEFTDFRYDEEFPPSLFTMTLPAGVISMNDPASKPAQLAFSGPREVASHFFNALAKEDWDSLLQVMRGTTVNPGVKQMYGGLQVISLGEAFQSGLFPGYFVPYEIRLRDGSVRTHKLAVRNDNPSHRWTIDGGY
jgi:outer membrane lipoprotein-sorting protein